jgi:hypothetical protein
VVRLAAEPAYTFLPPLFARVDDARSELASHEQPNPLTQPELDALRAAVLAAADALSKALAQARLLAEAALLEHPGWLGELGLDAKPRKRSVRAAAD